MKQEGKMKLRALVLMGLILMTTIKVSAQNILNKNIDIEVNRQRLDNVLEILSNKGNFYFSYNSSIINRDSLVTISAKNKTVKEILDMLLGSRYEYRESGNYIILRRAPIRLTLVTSQAITEGNNYFVSGYVIDEQTGEKIPDASIYEKQRLALASTNDVGYFKLKLKSRYKTAALTVSKQFYEDTTVIIQTGYNQQINVTIVPIEISGQTITITPETLYAPDSIVVEVQKPDSSRWLYTYIKKDSVKLEKSPFASFLLTSKQKLQSINLRNFFTARPVQFSVTPGLSSNGKMNAQVVNNFSFNIFGGYSGGVNGMELAGLFNIDKKTVQYLQIAGLSNIVGGSMIGLQIGGLHNTVLDSVAGLQVGGINNFVKSRIAGVQIGGLYNHVGDNMKGAQVAGLVNFVNRTTKGIQIGGIGNVSTYQVNGVQIASVFNYTRRLKGVQIGLINIADTSNGYSIGLINIVYHGYHKISLYTNEVLEANIALKSGNRKLYSILLAGANTKSTALTYSFGYGLGKEIPFSKRFGMNLELSSQYLYLGSWDYLNLLNRANLHLHIKFGKVFSIFAGPSYSMYTSNQPEGIPDYKYPIPPSSSHTYDFGGYWKGWFGWNVGINLF